jgi:hypothetical protein
VSERESVLEHNLRRLFARAWAPVAPRESFRAALEREFTARAAMRYGDTQRARRPWFRNPAQVALTAVAAVLVVALGLSILLDAWSPWGAEHGDYRSFVALGSVALRAGGGDWEAVAVPRDSALADLGRRDLPLEVVTPSTASARLALGAGMLEVGPGWSRFSASQAERAQLDSGSLSTELAPAQSLRVDTLAGGVELESARASLAYESGPEPVVRVDVFAGIARVEDQPEWRTLGAGESARLRSGRVLVQPTAAVETADARSEVARANADPAAPAAPSGEPPALSGTVTVASAGPDGVEQHAPLKRFRALLLEEVALPKGAMPEVLEVDDEGGRFVFQAVAPGTYTIFVQADGFAVARRTGLDLASGTPVEVELQLQRGTTVLGTVLDSRTGKGVSGAVVLSESDAPLKVLPIDRAALEQLGFVRFAISGPGGAFELADVERGRQVLRASEGGLSVGWAEPFELEGAAPLSGLEIRMPPGGAVEGEVRDELGAARAGMVVLASCTDFTKPRPCLSYKQVLTDEQGYYLIDGLPPGTVAVLLFGDPANLHGHEAPDLQLRVVRAGVTSVADFAPAQRTLRLEGKVVELDGSPLPGRSLWTLPTGTEPTESSLVSTTTRADGSFTFEGLEPGAREIFLSIHSPPEMVWLAHVDLLPGGLGPVRLEAGSTAVGGKALAAATLDPVRGGEVLLLERASNRFAGKVLLGEDGSFRFDHVHPGSYDVIVEPLDTALDVVVARGVELAAGEVVPDLELLAPAKQRK